MVVLAGLAVVRPVATAPAVVTGLGDQHASALVDPSFAAMPIDDVRLVVPWDAAGSSGPWDDWLAAATHRGLRPVVAFEHTRGQVCPGADCRAPSTRAYLDAVRAFLVAHPDVRTVVPWNEPNHRSQPTFDAPELASSYYRGLRAICPTCRVVAGDLLDDDDLPAWLDRYREGLGEEPTTWGLHNYYDALYLRSSGVDAMLSRTRGELWLTETGGIVRTIGADGRVAQPYDEERGARSVRWLYALADSRPRVTRMYLYGWRATTSDTFDSALLGYDGAPRPSFAVVLSRIGLRPGVPAPPIDASVAAGAPLAAQGSTPSGDRPARAEVAAAHEEAMRVGGSAVPTTGISVASVSGRVASLSGRRLRVGVSCVLGGPGARRCVGAMRVTIAGQRRAAHYDVAQGTVRSVSFRLRASTVARLTSVRWPRVAVRFCRAEVCGAPSAVPVRRAARR